MEFEYRPLQYTTPVTPLGAAGLMHDGRIIACRWVNLKQSHSPEVLLTDEASAFDVTGAAHGAEKQAFLNLKFDSIND